MRTTRYCVLGMLATLAAAVFSTSCGETLASIPGLIITGISPLSGPTAGNTIVTIRGTGIPSTVTKVSFGDSAATFNVSGDTMATVVTPKHAAGTVPVILTIGSSVDTVPNAFTYVDPPAPPGPPVLASISPSTGSSAGGTAFTIRGTALKTGATVSFAGVFATSVTVSGDSTIAGSTPPHAIGSVSVVVTNPDAQADTLVLGYTYGTPPAHAITALNRTAGSAAGGATVIVTGTNFVSGASVSFGATASTSVTVNSSTQLTVLVPAHAVGTVSVSVTQASVAATLPAAFEYLPAPTTTFFNTGFEGTLTPFTQNGTDAFSSLAVSTDFAFAGTRSAKSRRTNDGPAAATFFFGSGTPPNPALTEPNGLWVRWYMYIPTSTVQAVQGSGGQIKLLLYRRVAGSGQPGWLMCGIGSSFRGLPYTCFIDNGIFSITGGDTSFTLGDGVWMELQTCYQRSGGRGRARLWINGKQIFDVTDPLMGNDLPSDPYALALGLAYTQSPTAPILVYTDNAAGANGYIDP